MSELKETLGSLFESTIERVAQLLKHNGVETAMRTVPPHLDKEGEDKE